MTKVFTIIIKNRNARKTFKIFLRNVAYETDENESLSDPKLPSYSMASAVPRRHNSLPNLSKVERYHRLPGQSRLDRSTIRRTNSTNLFDHNPEDPPPYLGE